MTRRSVLLLATFALGAAAYQGNRKRVSPHETASVTLGSDTITITYGRPSLKGRKVGGEVAPYGQVWRLGADEATKLTVTGRTRLGDVELAPGSYSLFAIPGTGKWTLIINKVAEQWGAFSYQESEDVARFDVPVKHPGEPAEQFTISLTRQSEKRADLTFTWGDASVSTTVTAL